jgi:hypothetical protein
MEIESYAIDILARWLDWLRLQFSDSGTSNLLGANW